MREQLLYYACKYHGDYKRIKKAIEEEEDWEKISYPGNYITILDEKYPSCFKGLKYKPWVLFYEGDFNLLNTAMIGVVGSRNNSCYGEQCTSLLIANLNEKYGIVSGFAKGIDALAHFYALKQNRKTIAVLGCGIDVIYPKENTFLYNKIKKNGLFLSEYPQGSKPYAYHFPWRNRLIAAISDKLIVVEAKVKSGTMITVMEALELGKEVYAFPHNIDQENGKGCNKMIEQGCGMLNEIADIKEI